MKRFSLLLLLFIGLIASSPRVSAQVSLSFASFAIESGSDLQVGAVYRFSNVAPGLDALVEIESLVNGATLVQIDDPSPSSAELQPTLNGTPSTDPRADLSITLVTSTTATAVSVAGLQVAAIDVDGSTGRQEFVILAGVESYTVEGLAATAPQGPSELTITADPLGTRVLAPTTTYNGIDPTITQVIAVADAGPSSRFEFSIGQTGTSGTAGDRLFSWDFRVDQILFDDPTTTSLTSQIGSALAVGTITANGDGSYNIPMTFLVEGFADVPLFDIQIVDNLATSFGTYVPSGPLSAGQYTVDDPVVGALTGGAVLAAANTAFDGSSDQSLLALTAGDRLPVGGTAEVSFNVTWFPSAGVTSTTNQGSGRGDFSHNGSSDGSTTDASHAGSDPDPDSDGPANNSAVTSIDLSGLPVEMSSFDAVLDGDSVELRWETASETGNAGFDIEHRGPLDPEFVRLSFVDGSGTTTDATHYTFAVPNLTAGLHLFRLRQVDVDGSFAYSAIVEVAVELAESFELGLAFPNPFNPVTAIRYSLREAGPVDLSVFDVTGKRVRQLASGPQPAGTHEARFVADGLPSGLYIYRLATRSGSASAPVVLLK